MNPIETIYINNVATDVEVINGVFKFPYNIGQELTAIRFVGTNANNTITSINLKKADLFASVSHLDYCFMNCTALTEIDFGKKAFGSLQHAVDAFKGCTELTTIKIDASSEWAPDVDLSDCPLTYTSMLAFANALKTYNSGTHTIKFGSQFMELTPEQQATIKGIANSKNWNIPTFDQGKYTYQQLSAMIADGYVPVASYADYANIDVAGEHTMGAGSIFEGTYTTGTTAKYVQVKNFSITAGGTIYNKELAGIYDGAMLLIDARTKDWYNRAAFNTAETGVIRNVRYVGYLVFHGNDTCFVTNNYGTIEDCYIDARNNMGYSASSYALCAYNYGTIQRVRVRSFDLKASSSNINGWVVAMNENQGTIKDCYAYGTLDSGGSVSAFMKTNKGNIQNTYTNVLLYGVSFKSGMVITVSGGTSSDCYANTDRGATNATGSVLKTSAQLKADSIGSGIYANWDSSVWTKDIEGYPTLVSLSGIEEDFDFSDLPIDPTYLAMERIISVLPDYTGETAHILTVSSAFWNSITTAEQNTLTATATAKNWTIVH